VNVPIYAVNTENDRLYPPASMKPIIDALTGLGAPVTWRVIAEFGHDPSYVPGERPQILAWIAGTRRDPQPKRIVWEGTGSCRVRWLNVLDLGDAKDGADFPDVNPKLPPGRVRIGVVIDQAFEGEGILVQEVQKDMPAGAIGIEPGDIIAGLDGAPMRNMEELQRALGGKKFGDAFRISIRRGEGTLEKEGRFPDASPQEAFRREQPYGSIEASATDNLVDVRARGIRAFDVYLSEPLFDLSKPITVRVNGRTAYEGIVEPDLRFLAGQACADGDRTMVYLARLRINVP